MKKPGYNLTRQAFWASFCFAWLVILAIVIRGLQGSREAVELAPLVIPSMIALIATLLGIHRGFGSLDFRASQERDGFPLPVTDPGGDRQ